MAPFNFGSLAFSIANTSVDDIEIRDIPGPAIGTFNFQSTSFQLTYATKLTESISVGISPKYIYEKNFTDESSGYGIDAGILYSPSIDHLILGLSLTDIGSLSAYRTEEIDLPTVIRIGCTYSIPLDKTILIRAATSFSSELNTSIKHFNLGGEMIYDNTLFARIGFQTGYDLRNISAGLGLCYNVAVIDYAYIPFSGEAGNAHIMSICFNF